MGRDEGEGSGGNPPGRRKRPPLVSRRQATDAAYQLIAAEGPLGLSMRKLATALHVSLPTVYTAVDSRETLIGELQDRVVTEIAAAVAVERLADGKAELREVATDLLGWVRQRPQLARFLIVEPMSVSVAQRALERATPAQRAAGRSLLADRADLADLADLHGAEASPPPPASALAFVFAEVRAMLWLVVQDDLDDVDASTWLAIGCENVARGLAALAGGAAVRR